ncbi:glycoside hydrolase family 92 protein [Cercospora zeae-maydis SCOH1-5]|uniref:Glycoside hydrolase family 92 protein n=1 Tax=Cercospora zeae-maydis SCOH1-5 TaxID=717836 RepID=A0A6A6FE88_9PEZI|nr:glycoside hydrolase family 92 protein [Cercospora zeae-maydis SCOH1-5]
MRRRRPWSLALCLLTTSTLAQDQQNVSTRLTSYVDPLIGTVGSTPGSAIAGGNSFPGPALPWGLAKPGIDTSYLGVPNGTAVDCNAGYSPLGNVTGISMTHVSGTGGVPTYGLISQMPLYGDLSGINLADNTTYWQNRSVEDETATVGHFRTVLLSGIEVDITSSRHAGLIKYTFPASVASNASISESATDFSKTATTQDAHIVVDLTHVLPGYGTQAYSQRYTHGTLHTRTGSNGQPSYSGSATYTGGWSQPQSHTLYFCGNFSAMNLEPTDAYVTQNSRDRVRGAGTINWPYSTTGPPVFKNRPIPRSYTELEAFAGNGMGIGALFSWTPAATNASAAREILSRVGMSYVSHKQACLNSADELPADLSFADVVERSRKEWEEQILGTIEVVDDGSVGSSNTTLKRMLYTALYQTGLMPTDKTGENPAGYDGIPYFDDHYTLWDTYRSLMPLYHLLYTGTYSRVIKGLISIFTVEGWLPAGRIANWNGRVQGGTHADMVLADAYVKNGGELSDDIDWHEAYRAVLNDALEEPIHNTDTAAFDGATKEGRGALDDYLILGFITRNHTRSISRGVEYSQNDFAIYSMSKTLSNSTTQTATFLQKSSWWQNQWSSTAKTSLFIPTLSNSTTNTTFTGFPAPRNMDRTFNFTSYDPLTCGTCSWSDDIYEAKPWETAFGAAPHDMSTLITLMGNASNFIQRLDASFIPGLGSSVGANNDAGTALFNPGNEPSFLTPYLYNYVSGHQWKTVQKTREIVDQYYSDQRDGYPGNIDGGALPSWLVFGLIGFYPVAAQPVYLLGAPRFSSLRIKLFSGTRRETTLSITAPGLSDTSFYPQSITFNGKNHNRSWLSHEELSRGGKLIFHMGSQPAAWDIGERPPSLSGWS